ncbi:aminoglycoside phosphotransferase family protein [Maritalea sp.]|uniref:aminoglycoside phosphotransferase family protein n=1 Tax=Maritalea sp. TaxID=2003361 RepID=UPI003EF532EF
MQSAKFGDIASNECAGYCIAMNTAPFPEPHILNSHKLSNPQFVESTAFGDIWRVKASDGTALALKIYGPRGMRNEAGGFDFLRSRNGLGCAKVHFADQKIALLEWLDGASLGDVARNGDDQSANTVLVEVANKIHSVNPKVEFELRTVDIWFEALLGLAMSPNANPNGVRAMRQAQQLAKLALAEQEAPMPLHGDLHHENVRLGTRGYCAFDAKGVVGEKAFELANAFRNPRGIREIVYDRTRVEALADFWSTAFGVERFKLVRWAAVRSALSIAWRCKDRTFVGDDEIELLDILLSAADQH